MNLPHEVLALEPFLMPPAVWEAIVAHAREGKPQEVCGIVRGRRLAAHSVLRGRNLAAEPIENYEVDAHTLLQQFAFEDEGDEMVAIYHSHPVSVAYPSATDAWNAHYPECVYLICSLEFDEAPVVRAFRLTPHYGALDVEALRGALPFYETRPGLFAFYQPAGEPLPQALGEALEGMAVPAPFYLDYLVDERGDVAGSSLVAVAEHPVVVG
jgi:proteasome lid subunit RPN8/RPN11